MQVHLLRQGLCQAYCRRNLALQGVQEDDCRRRLDRLDHRGRDCPEVSAPFPSRSLTNSRARPPAAVTPSHLEFRVEAARTDATMPVQYRPSSPRARRGLNHSPNPISWLSV